MNFVPFCIGLFLAVLLTSAATPLQPQILTFAYSSMVKKLGDSAFTNTLTQTGTGALSFTSSNYGVLSVTGNGQVTIVGPGFATISVVAATVPGKWFAAAASYTVMVQP